MTADIPSFRDALLLRNTWQRPALHRVFALAWMVGVARRPASLLPGPGRRAAWTRISGVSSRASWPGLIVFRPPAIPAIDPENRPWAWQSPYSLYHLHVFYGIFDDRNREFVVTRPGHPAAWLNMLGQDDFYGLCPQPAGGYAFLEDPACAA